MTTGVRKDGRGERHGRSGTPVYVCWQKMVRRCHDEGDRAYPDYGGRGIRVCDEWRRSFSAFLADVGEKGDDDTVERVDVDGHYEPGNVIWLPRAYQNKNKRNNRRIEHGGVTKIAADWAREFGVSAGALLYRLDSGVPFEDAVTKVVQSRVMTRLYRGEQKATAELEAVAGVPHKTITDRIRSGWSVEEAVETPVSQARKSSEIEWEGRKWSIVALAEHVGMSHRTLYARLRYYGFTVAEAIQTPVKTSGRHCYRKTPTINQQPQ